MHQIHKAVKANGLLAAHTQGFGVQADQEPFLKSYSFQYNLAVCLIMQRCFLLMQDAFIYFAGDGCD